MHGISTGREGIPRREGQFRFTVPREVPLVPPPPSPLAPFRFFQPASFIAGARARREEFIPIALSALYYRRRPKESGESSGRIGARAMTARKRVLFFSSTALTLIVLTLRVT